MTNVDLQELATLDDGDINGNTRFVWAVVW